jgi:tRNA nucleotidyltransferase (CCA-adding enzyme)
MPDIDANLARLESGAAFSEQERHILSLFLRASGAFSPAPTVRIVGGYVRDALLGIRSNDIDISVDGVPCEAYAEKLNEFAGGDHRLANFAANPERGKLLSTTRVKVVADNWIDICALQAPSRDASVVPTPATDARRRDFTVNALAFNVNTSKVEDFVSGIEDLKSGFLRTPIDPYETFSDDPLRILRCFRFALRFNFSIDPLIFEASARVARELGLVIARERIQTELCKLVESRNALGILDWIIDAGIFMALFDPRGDWQVSEPLAVARARVALGRSASPSTNLLALLAAVYFEAESITGAKIPKKYSIFDVILTKFQAMPVRVGQAVALLVSAAKRVPALMGDVSRLTVGKWLRMAGAAWSDVRCVLFDDGVLAFWDAVLMPFIDREALADVIAMKPLMHGTELAQAHGVTPGPILGQLTEALIEWQILHPGEGAAEYRRAIARSKPA